MHARILAAVALTLPLSARAAGPGPEIAVRTGFSLPFGSIAGNAGSLSDAFTGLVPIGAELGWRLTPNLYAGAAFGYAFGLTKNCPPGDRCSGHDVGLGIDVRYHALPDERIDPWIGVGAGYEWLSLSTNTGSNRIDLTADGFEFVHADFGADFFATRNVRVGPVVQLRVGRYRGAKVATASGSASASFTDKTVHEFLTFGVKVSLLF